MPTSIQLASTIIAGIVCFGLLIYVFLLVTNLSSDEAQAVGNGKVTRQEWRRRSAWIIGGCSIVFFGLLIVTI